MAFAILRTRKLTSWAMVAAAGRHNSRQSSPINADPDGRIVHLVGAGDIVAEARARMVSAGIDPARLRKNAVVAVEVLLTASPGYFRPGRTGSAGVWDPDRLNAWLDAVKRFLAAEWGDRVVSVTLHLDESTVHMHVCWCGVDDTPRTRGPPVRLNVGRWLDGAAKLRALQDRYAAAMAELGLERGVRRSRASHQDVRRMYGSMQSDAEAATLARSQAEGLERQARTLLDQAEAIYRQAAELLPALARSVLAKPIKRLGALLRRPVAERERQPILER
jgi:Plasmid recombination enzyme